MTRLGDVNRFGVELELDQGSHDESMFGRIRFWTQGESIGEWRGTSLHRVLNQLSRIHANVGQRQNVRFIDAHPARALELIYSAGSQRWERVANDEQWARHRILPPVDAFDGWRAVLIEDLSIARLLVRHDGEDVREHRLDAGEVDRVFATLIDELEALHARARARRRGLRVDVRTVRIRSEGPATGHVAIT